MNSTPHTPWGDRARLALWLALLLSWLVLLPRLWTAFSTVPSIERLEQSRMVEIPTLRTVGLLVAQTAFEVGLLLALLWPWRAGSYLTRLWFAAVGVWAWFLATTPLGLTRMSWVHRRWLALVGLVLVLSCLTATGVRVLSRARVRGEEGPA